jgi:hypothetical protein
MCLVSPRSNRQTMLPACNCACNPSTVSACRCSCHAPSPAASPAPPLSAAAETRLVAYRVAALPVAETLLSVGETSSATHAPEEICRAIAERAEMLARAMLAAEKGGAS